MSTNCKNRCLVCLITVGLLLICASQSRAQFILGGQGMNGVGMIGINGMGMNGAGMNGAGMNGAGMNGMTGANAPISNMMFLGGFAGSGAMMNMGMMGMGGTGMMGTSSVGGTSGSGNVMGTPTIILQGAPGTGSILGAGANQPNQIIQGTPPTDRNGRQGTIGIVAVDQTGGVTWLQKPALPATAPPYYPTGSYSKTGYRTKTLVRPPTSGMATTQATPTQMWQTMMMGQMIQQQSQQLQQSVVTGFQLLGGGMMNQAGASGQVGMTAAGGGMAGIGGGMMGGGMGMMGMGGMGMMGMGGGVLGGMPGVFN